MADRLSRQVLHVISITRMFAALQPGRAQDRPQQCHNQACLKLKGSMQWKLCRAS